MKFSVSQAQLSATKRKRSSAHLKRSSGAAQGVKSFSSSHSARNGVLTVRALRALSGNRRDFVEIVQLALLSANIPRVLSSLATRVSHSE